MDDVAFVEAAYKAMATGDIPWMQEHTHEDVVFVQGGRFPTAGEHRGRDAMFDHFMEFMTLVEGSFSIDLKEVLAGPHRVAAVISVTIGLAGRTLTFDEIHLWRIEDGLLTEMRAIPFDPYVVDAFFAV
jgi:ketosteroid isomerase-like protein